MNGREDIEHNIIENRGVQTEWDEIDRVNRDTLDITPVISKIILMVYEKEEFQNVMDKIGLAISQYGFEKIQQDFLIIDRQISAGVVDFKQLPQNLQLFMKSVYYCLNRLAEHFPEEWGQNSQNFEKQAKAQLMELYGVDLQAMYDKALAEIGNPSVSEETKAKIFSAMLIKLSATIHPYKFDFRESVNEMFQIYKSEVQSILKDYILMMIK